MLEAPNYFLRDFLLFLWLMKILTRCILILFRKLIYPVS